jgi:hypothetical protein
MKKVARLGSMAGLAVAALIAGPSAAHAVDGSVSSVYYSPNGGGAKATAYVDFASSNTVYWRDIYLNDFCPGDGERAKIKFVVRYEGDSGWTSVGSREDIGGCDSAPYTESLVSWTSSRRINDATVVACVVNIGCASADASYRDNPYWG